MNSATFVLYFSILLSCVFCRTTRKRVESCSYCNGNCTEPKVVNCTRPDSGCIAYKVEQENRIDIFKNCFASSTWNCERVKKWISSKHLNISVVDCHVCMESQCNADIYKTKNSSSKITSNYLLVNTLCSFMLLFMVIL